MLKILRIPLDETKFISNSKMACSVFLVFGSLAGGTSNQVAGCIMSLLTITLIGFGLSNLIVLGPSQQSKE